jgi:uracil-DNA glycosylase family 4
VFTSEDPNKIADMKRLSERNTKCTNCKLYECATHVVMGSGNLDSEIVLVGEAPGRKEDELGLPFVGTAGDLLDKLLDKICLRREDLFITNILKCRPPNNRRPKKGEISDCEPILIEQLRIVKPKVIVPMGNSAISYFFERYGLGNAVIGNVHGKMFEVENGWGKLTLLPLYHPAAAIYRRSLLSELENDMRILKSLKLLQCL